MDDGHGSKQLGMAILACPVLASYETWVPTLGNKIVELIGMPYYTFVTLSACGGPLPRA